MAARKLKVLGLHGYRTSAEIMELQAMILTDETRDFVEYKFINGFHVSKGSPPASVSAHFKPPYYQWYEHPSTATEEAANNPDKAPAPEADENRPDEQRHEAEFAGFEDTIKALEELMSKEPVDGLVCFSQGTVVGAVLMALAERKEHPVFSQLKFGMFFSSSKPVFPEAYSDVVTAAPLKTPSLHCNGTAADEDQEHVKAYIGIWEPATRTELTHSEGHKFPTSLADLALYDSIVAWLKEQKKLL